MGFIKDMPVAGKLALNAAVTLLLIVLLFLSAWFGFGTIQERTNRVADMERSAAALQLMMRGATEFIVTEGTPASRKLAQEGIERFDALITKLSAEASDQRFTQQVAPQWQVLRRDIQKFLGASVGKISVNDDEAMLRFGALSNIVDTILKEISNTTREEGRAAAELRRLVTIIMLSCLGAALVLVVLISAVINRSITRPLGHLQDTIVRVEDSGDLTLRVGAKGRDEVGRTAAAFDKMIAKIADLVGDARQSAEAISVAAQSMSVAGSLVEKSSGTQSEAASAVAAAVEQTSASISETASNAHMASETATRARGDIDKTLGAVREAAENVDRLAAKISEASVDIAHLAESSRQIEGIVKTIKDIADQTNLLALNAAIEAARAGEQGRGFAVVADEVRKLAENTTRSTSEISSLIDSVQTQVDAAVTRMREANDKAGTTRDRVVASTGALDSASADTGRVTDAVRSIADAMREQNAAVQQVAQRIEQIAQMTEEETAAAANAAGTARQLDALANKLRAAVGRFKV